MTQQQPLPHNTVLLGNNKTYLITGLIGRGGFGITYRAEVYDGAGNPTGESVAIKEFFPKDMCSRTAGTPDVIIDSVERIEMIRRLRDRFIKESRNLAACDTPSVVKVLDTIEANGTAYMVMELIDGKTLKEFMADNNNAPLSPAMAMKFILQAARALGYLHAKRINHLDVKPDNMMVTNDLSRVVLIDFGLSRQYKSDGSSDSEILAAVSKGYASPEQYSGVKQFSPESDIYALGATLYKLVTGQTPPEPFDLVENPSLLTFPPGTPVEIAEAVRRSMVIERTKRINSADAFIRILNSDTIVTPPPPPPPPFEDDDDDDDEEEENYTGRSHFNAWMNVLLVLTLGAIGLVSYDVLQYSMKNPAYEISIGSESYDILNVGVLVFLLAAVNTAIFGLVTRNKFLKFFWFIISAAIVGCQFYYVMT